jgi:GT2 family glycosyltransferase
VSPDETTLGPGAAQRGPRVLAILVTFRRPGELRICLQRLAAQSRPPDHLWVVDNAPTPETRSTVEGFGRAAIPTTYVPSQDNLGPAGGIALGMELAMAEAATGDWLLLLDDDNPCFAPWVVERLLAFGRAMRDRDPRIAGVGVLGGRFDARRGRVARVGDHELAGAVEVDYVPGGWFPMYLAEAVRAVGLFDRSLFFGLDDLEFGLRLRRSGYRLFCPGELWRERRHAAGRLGWSGTPSRRVGDPTWRRYYSLRNLILILRRYGWPLGAARVTVVHGLAKPMANLPIAPRLALRNLALNCRACLDGWSGRQGRTVEP